MAKSAASTEGIVKHVSGLVRFYMGNREETQFQLKGRHSVILIRDYVESVAGRGRAFHSTAKHALIARAEALGIDWPLTNPLVAPASVFEATDAPRQAPAMSIETVRSREEIAVNKLVTPRKREFAAGILVVEYSSPRFTDVKNSGSLNLTMIQCTVHISTAKWRKPADSSGRGRARVKE